jgi:hypothetical protein
MGNKYLTDLSKIMAGLYYATSHVVTRIDQVGNTIRDQEIRELRPVFCR